MRIAVFGTGGAGGFFGAQLARAGEDVVFIARGDHLRAIRSAGLHVETPAGEILIHPAQATDDPASYAKSQALGNRLRAEGSNGIAYDSVRDPGHACLVAFRPKLVHNVRQGAHFQYVWRGGSVPEIRRLKT